MSDIFMSNEDRAVKERIKKIKNSYLTKSDKDYIYDVTMSITKSVLLPASKISAILKNSPEVKQLIKNFKDFDKFRINTTSFSVYYEQNGFS